jgi:hypothetical protein
MCPPVQAVSDNEKMKTFAVQLNVAADDLQ